MSDQDDRNPGISGLLFAIVLIFCGVITFYEFVLPLFFRRHETHYCRADYEAQNVLASLHCYFSEPSNKSCTSIERLLNDPDCGFEPNHHIDLTQIGTGSDAYWIITVTEANERCKKGKYFRAYCGNSNLVDGWSD